MSEHLWTEEMAKYRSRTPERLVYEMFTIDTELMVTLQDQEIRQTFQNLLLTTLSNAQEKLAENPKASAGTRKIGAVLLYFQQDKTYEQIGSVQAPPVNSERARQLVNDGVHRLIMDVVGNFIVGDEVLDATLEPLRQFIIDIAPTGVTAQKIELYRERRKRFEERLAQYAEVDNSLKEVDILRFFSQRTLNTLRRQKLTLLRLLDMTDEELRSLPKIGEGTVAEIRRALAHIPDRRSTPEEDN